MLLFERSWRLIAPPLFVLGFFVCLSWTGLWLAAPHWARALGSLFLAVGVILALLPLRKFRLPSRSEALARIDRISGLGHRPAAVLEDRLGNGGADPATRALWSLHRRRAEQIVAALRTGLPSPRMVDLDRYALRAAILIGLVATGFIAGPERYARLAAAFDWRFDGFHGEDARLDAWIDPPAYTGKTPIVLNPRATGQDAAHKIEAPTGSVVIIRSSAGKATLEATGALVPAAQDKETAAATLAVPAATPPKGDNETRLVLRGDASLALAAGGRSAAFDLRAIPDAPPTIALADAPKVNARGSLALAYEIADDYGVVNAEALFANPLLENGKPSKRSLVDPPRVALALPSAGERSGEADATIDLSEHPWAGARVEMTLVARDEGGNEGKSASIEIVLPQKPFAKPLARALAEQRRNLILAPSDAARVATAIKALMIAPEAFGTSAGVYLGLRAASNQLAAARHDSDLVEVADLLWAMALRIENGDLSEAERDLRAAEQQLREALQRNAPEEEISKLSENLRAAMDKFLREFAAQQQQNQTGQSDPAAGKSRNRAVNPKELQAMLDQMQEMARSGNVADAQKMLERLQNILENLQMARPRKSNPQAREMSRALDELDQMTKEQQDLRDETHQSREAQKRRQRRQFGLPNQPGLGELLNQDSGDDQDPESGENGADVQISEAELAKRQQALRDRLEKAQKRLKQAGQAGAGLDDAHGAMKEAEKALGQGPGGGDEALDAQGRALEALRRGTQELAENMRGQGEGEASGEADGEGEDGEGQGPNGQFGEEGADPLGRPSGRERAFNPGARFNPLGVPAAQRAQRVLEELRRRLGEPARPRDEMDYLERLLRRY